MTLAWIDVAGEMLPQLLGMLPKTIRIAGSETRRDGVVRLVLDVTATGIPVGGEWIGMFSVAGAKFSVEFMPHLRVPAKAA